jgi:hypothetical protein
MERIPPKEIAGKIAKLLRKQRPDSSYVKKIFQYVREDLDFKKNNSKHRRLPELMTNEELKEFYDAVGTGHQSNKIME